MRKFFLAALFFATIFFAPDIYANIGVAIEGGHPLVPVRGFFEQLDFYVEWDAKLQQVTLSGNDFIVVITPGSYASTINGQNFALYTPAQIIDGRTMLHLQDILGITYYFAWAGGAAVVGANPFLEQTVPVAPDVPVRETLQFGGHSWIVLAVDGDYAKILRERVIVNQPYHHTYEPITLETSVTWEISTSRAWLNNDFYNTFSEADRARIRETYLVNSDNPRWQTPGGANTTDKIFLLSIDEVVQHFGDSGQVSTRNMINDAYNKARRAFDDAGSASWWWLRSPGSWTFDAAKVYQGGSLATFGVNAARSNGRGGLRPALWLRLAH